ncbi:enoyl-CoA hydratase/isomerase family protein [Dictyobacter kobayashii]|uniref:Enoyl-CoA hydratase n=1 Tax=Dictyobacter kobayashii TaxID=2014872 RepID=A0A402AD62_9CHLR|nr:enoyl-CoA hydratase/isomerase family protein [Dictyobacter kobayashii]GCE17040.1 enoyl-CoA hydratase [Dictyobacter kobayashii]
MAEKYQQLKVDYRSGNKIAVVTLQRSQVRNALNAQLIQELTAVFTELSIDEQLHAVILTGEGKAFCAGADINMMREAIAYTAEQNIEDALRLSDMLHAINTFPCPVIARVNGDALGGGVGLLAVCDIVIATEGARLAFSEVKLGIAPAVISPYVLRKIGENMARVLFVTGERFSATRAHEIGLVHSVVPAEHLDDAVSRAVNELISGGPQAIRACKALALQVSQMNTENARRYTAETIAHLRVGPEGQEGLQAFLEKRPPHWLG